MDIASFEAAKTELTKAISDLDNLSAKIAEQEARFVGIEAKRQTLVDDVRKEVLAAVRETAVEAVRAVVNQCGVQSAPAIQLS